MVRPRDDALLHDMIAAERKYSERLRNRRAEAIYRCEPPDVLAFYDQQIEDTDRRISFLLGRPENEENR